VYSRAIGLAARTRRCSRWLSASGRTPPCTAFDRALQDWAAERTNFPREVVEAALAHALADKVEAAYRRSDLFEKRRRLMNEWARYCDRGIASSGAADSNLITLAKRYCAGKTLLLGAPGKTPDRAFGARRSPVKSALSLQSGSSSALQVGWTETRSSRS
jgi:hypothetical protein